MILTGIHPGIAKNAIETGVLSVEFIMKRILRSDLKHIKLAPPYILIDSKYRGAM
jgi:hypothetical protein